jgi:hypothetical protein
MRRAERAIRWLFGWGAQVGALAALATPTTALAEDDVDRLLDTVVAPAPRGAQKPAQKPGAPVAPTRAAPAVPAPAAPAVIHCASPADVATGEKIIVRCEVEAGHGVVAVTVNFRVNGSEDYRPIPSLRVQKGRFEATIHPSEIVGRTVHFFAEARDEEDEVVAGSGDEESPHLVSVRAVTPPGSGAQGAAEGRGIAGVSGATALESASTEEDPLLIHATPAPSKSAAIERRVGSYFVGLGAGGGYGWHPRRRLDYRRDLMVDRGNGFAGRPQILPEAGLQLTRELAVSLQLRHQTVGSDGWGDTTPGAPPTSAWAALARARYLLGLGRLRFAPSVALGAGEGIRVEVPATPEATLWRSDTVVGGPIVAGFGAGLLVHLTARIAIVAEARALAGFPRVAAALEASLGVELGL